MKRGFKILCIILAGCCLLALLVNHLSINYYFFTLFGLINLVVSAVSLIIGFIIIAAGDKSLGGDLCFAAGLLLLVGIGACSVFPLRLNH